MEDKVMKFNSQICTTKEQSERLLALGLKKGTADMAIISHPHKDIKWQLPITEVGKNTKHIPAWSLHRLFELYTKGFRNSSWNMAQFDWDSLIDCIELKINEGYFNKEYLEE